MGYPTNNSWDASGSAAYLRAVTYTRHLAGTAGFGTATFPSISEVFGLADDAYFEIAAMLENYGYSRTQSGSAVMGVLQSLHAIELVGKIELVAPTNSQNEDGNSRYKALQGARDRIVKLIEGRGLSVMGATISTAKSAHIVSTGASKSDKDARYDDTDLVQPRFPRGWGQDATLSGSDDLDGE